MIAVTHGHGDHAGDVVALQQKLGCKVIGMVELMAWFSQNGIAEDEPRRLQQGRHGRGRRASASR